MKRETKYFIAGIIVALIAPLLLDWALFGTVTPCDIAIGHLAARGFIVEEYPIGGDV